MSPATVQNNSSSLQTQEEIFTFLLEEAHTHGYISGMTDTQEQHHQAVSKELHVRIKPFMKAYKGLLAEKLAIQADIRAQLDTTKRTIAIVAIMQESDYLTNLDKIYQWERALEDLLFQVFPSISSYCIDTS
ncbi:MAG: hypothetical protein PHC61_00610, partial [Chitinivibrionales bacterium]|nr:hypothetical protein [Chitinivibrionales bacterium]